MVHHVLHQIGINIHQVVKYPLLVYKIKSFKWKKHIIQQMKNYKLHYKN